MNTADKARAWEAIVQWMHDSDLLFPPASTVRPDLSYVRPTDLKISIQRLRPTGRVPPAADNELIFSDEQIAALKKLVSTAVWIRSEQLAHPNVVMDLESYDAKGVPVGASTLIDTHNMCMRALRTEFETGQQLFTLLQQYCAAHAIPDPEWRK